MELDVLSRGMAEAAAGIDEVGRRLRSAHSPTLGGDSTGQLGALGRDLAALFAETVSARAAEAATAGSHAAELADGVGRAAVEYRAVETARAKRS